MEIKNIVFDIGNVLLLWNPEKVFTKIFNRYDFHNHPLSTIVGGKIWLELDQGLLTLEEGIERSVLGNETFYNGPMLLDKKRCAWTLFSTPF